MPNPGLFTAWIKEGFAMKMLYSIKNYFENFEYCIRELLIAEAFWRYRKSRTIECFIHFRPEVHNRRDLSSSIMFRSNFLQQFIYAWTISLMEYIAFKYVLDFDLERPTYAKRLEI